MTWRDRLQPASLDGVGFFFDDVSTTTGRKTQLHEHYGERDPWVEDLGKATFRTTMNVFIVGVDYDITRQALVDVLESPGPYELIHPLWGIFTVRSDGPTEFTEKRVEGGMVRIGRLSLVESGLDFPQVIDGAGKLTELAALAIDALSANTSFSTKGGIDTVLASITGGIFKATSVLRKVNGKIGAKLNAIDQVSAGINDFENSIGTLLNTPNALMSSLNGLGLAVMGVIANFKPPIKSVEVEEPVFPVVESAADAVTEMTGFETIPDTSAWVPPGGAQAAIDDAAHAEVSLQMQATGVIGGADLAGSLPFESAVQAGAMLELLVDGFEQVLGAEGLSQVTYEAVAALKAATVEHLIAQQAQLPQVVIVTPSTVMPAIVLAFELLGDAERGRELALRNKVRHPGFVPAEPLEVVVDA